MPDCECIAGCPFFHGKMASVLPAMIDMMRTKYCQGSNAECARHQVFAALGKGNVPPDLIPNQQERVSAIIARGKTQVAR